MSDGFIKWYRGATSAEGFLSQVREFADSGLHLVHPVRGAALALTADGEQIEVAPMELASLIGRRFGERYTVQWWLSPDADVVSPFAFVPTNGEVQTYLLDGLSRDECAKVCDVLRKQFFDHANASDCLVMDTAGRTAEFPWDDYVLYDDGCVSVMPDELILRTRPRKAELPRPTATSGDFLEFRRDD